MFLIMGSLFIALLFVMFFLLYKSERSSAKHRLPHAKMEGYWNGRERRKYRRFDKGLEVRYIVEKRPHLKKNARTLNISEGGMMLVLDEKLAKGTILDLQISLSNSKNTAEIEGEVVWSDETPQEKDALGKRLFRSGIKFLALKEPSGTNLIEFLRSLPSEGEPQGL